MATVDIHSFDGKVVGKADLDDGVFGVELSEGAIYQAVRAYQTNHRQGTAATKTRAEVFLTKRKMYRQKGTGRSRAGKASSPIRVGGGIAHGPQPRFYNERLPQKVKQLALKSALSIKASSGDVKVVESFTMEKPKTGTIAGMTRAIGVDQARALLLTDVPDANVVKSCRNIAGLEVRPVTQVCAYDVLLADSVIFTQTALDRAQSIWGPS